MWLCGPLNSLPALFLYHPWYFDLLLFHSCYMSVTSIFNFLSINVSFLFRSCSFVFNLFSISVRFLLLFWTISVSFSFHLCAFLFHFIYISFCFCSVSLPSLYIFRSTCILLLYHFCSMFVSFLFSFPVQFKIHFCLPLFPIWFLSQLYAISFPILFLFCSNFVLRLFQLLSICNMCFQVFRPFLFYFTFTFVLFPFFSWSITVPAQI